MKGQNLNSQLTKTNSQNAKSNPQSYSRTFSDELKRKKVKEINSGLSTVLEVSRSLEVSTTAIYKWKKKYSVDYEKPIKLIVESKSESKKVLQLKEQIKELEQALGQKQLQLDFKDKMIEIASNELGIDIKKKFNTRRYYGTGKIVNR